MISILSSSTFSFPKSEDRQNQDSVLPPKRLNDGYLVAIADGVGGYKGGMEASSLVISYLSEINNFSCANVDELFHNLRKQVASLSKHDESLYAAATTLTFGYIDKNGLTIGHSGDCRLYLKNENKLKQVTKDHTQHQLLIDDGIFTARQLKKASGKNIITAAVSAKIPLAYQSFLIPIENLPIKNGELSLFIMSDGAHSFWEERPRFSPNTLSNPSRFSASLQKRIEKKGPTDDYSLIALKIRF